MLTKDVIYNYGAKVVIICEKHKILNKFKCMANFGEKH